MKNPTLKEIMETPALCENLAQTLFDHLSTDDEPLDKIGFQLCKALLEEDAEAVLIAICGWSSDSLISLMTGNW